MAVSRNGGEYEIIASYLLPTFAFPQVAHSSYHWSVPRVRFTTDLNKGYSFGTDNTSGSFACILYLHFDSKSSLGGDQINRQMSGKHVKFTASEPRQKIHFACELLR
jgi:hypothetical protein